MKCKWAIILIVCILAGCSSTKKNNESIQNPESPSPRIDEIRLPHAPGDLTKSDDLVLIDYSCTDQGYIQVKTLREDHKRLKIKITLNGEEYNYDINSKGDYETFPLNMGQGTYMISVYENIEQTRYVQLYTFEIEVTLQDEFISYLYPNQIVDYNESTEAVKKSFELTEKDKTELDRVTSIYNYVTNTINYDWDKVEEVQGVYVLPVLDEILDKKKGICFDYAALMATMLRVQNIPTKVVTGYVDEGYHAWVEVYVHNRGWVTPHIYFENEKWTLMDPTFDSIGNNYKGKYSTKYQY